LDLWSLSVINQKSILAGFNPMIVEIFMDFFFLLLVYKSVGTHVYEFFQVIIRKDVAETSANVHLVFVDVSALIHDQ